MEQVGFHHIVNAKKYIWLIFKEFVTYNSCSGHVTDIYYWSNESFIICLIRKVLLPLHPESVLGMPSCAQLHYKKDQIESCPLGWARNFFMTYLMENLVVTEKIANFVLTKCRY